MGDEGPERAGPRPATTQHFRGGGLEPLRFVDENEHAHEPVLVDEALALLRLEAGGYYVDATFGRGGHTARILSALGGEGRVLALDRDPQAIEAGRRRFASSCRAMRMGARAAACCSTSVSPRRSSMIRAAASASAPTARSTCAWT